MDLRELGAGDEDLLIRAVAMIEEADLSPAQAAAHLADPSLVAMVAVEKGQVAGFIYGYVLRRFEATTFFIYSVDVAEAFRRRGIASAMLARLRVIGAARGWDESFVLTNRSNEAAMRLYQSAGGVAPPPDDVVMFDFD